MKKTISSNLSNQNHENLNFINEINYCAILIDSNLSILHYNTSFRKHFKLDGSLNWDTLFEFGQNNTVKNQLQQNIQSTQSFSNDKIRYKFNFQKAEIHRKYKIKVVPLDLPIFKNCFLLLFKECEKIDSKKFLKSILNTTQNLVYIHSFSENRLKYLSKNVALFSQVTNNEITIPNLDWSKIIHPDDLEKLNQHQKELFQSKDNSIKTVKFRFKDKKNNWRTFLSRDCVFKRNNEEIPTEYLAIATDITDIAQAQEQLHEQNIILKNSNNDLHSFSSIASHDLKEPLRKIQFFGQLLKDKEIEKLSSDSKIYLDKIISSSNRLQILIDDLIAFTQSDYHKNKFSKISLHKVIQTVNEDLADLISETQAKIVVNDLPNAAILESQFKQLFNNLINNAIKYRKKDIQPIIQINSSILTDLEQKDLKLFPSGTKIFKITVEDNGIGFDNIFKEKIFEPFQRLHSKNEFSGTGIGLSICKKIMKNHNGLITAESITDSGSTFTIYLPESQSIKKRQ